MLKPSKEVEGDRHKLFVAENLGQPSQHSERTSVTTAVSDRLSHRLQSQPQQWESQSRSQSARMVRSGLRELSRETRVTMTPSQRLKQRVAVQTIQVSGLGRRGPSVSARGVSAVLQPSSEGASVRQRHTSIVQSPLNSPNVRWQRSVSLSDGSLDSSMLDDHNPEGGMHMDMWTVSSPQTLILGYENSDGEGHYSPDMQPCMSSPTQTPPSQPSSPRTQALDELQARSYKITVTGISGTSPPLPHLHIARL